MIMSGIRAWWPAGVAGRLRSRRSLTRAVVLAAMATLMAACESRLVPAARAAEGTTAVAFADFLQERGIDASVLPTRFTGETAPDAAADGDDDIGDGDEADTREPPEPDELPEEQE